MKTSHILCIFTAVCALIISGCATTDSTREGASKQSQPPKDQRPIEERLKVGMTKDEVRSAIGEPSGKAVRSSGEETWNYSDNAKMFIPFYAISGGKFQNLTINFDSTGKIKDWASGKQGIF
jgi:outer membrane protein assembly factor BamE (lipoprotein component of BamABCDE complex)